MAPVEADQRTVYGSHAELVVVFPTASTDLLHTAGYTDISLGRSVCVMLCSGGVLWYKVMMVTVPLSTA